MKETKLYFETLFSAGWSLTPIHYAGQEFDQEGTKRWVNPVYTPLRTDNSGISETGRRAYGLFNVICWAENDVEAMDLADSVVEFMDANVETNQYSLNGYTIEDHGWHKTNKVYIYLSFKTTFYLC